MGGMRRVLVTGAALVLLATMSSSCGGGGGDDDGGEKASAGGSTTTAADDGDATTTTASDGTTTSLGPGSTVKATGDAEPGGYGWDASPTDYRGLLLIVSSKTPDIPPAGCAVALATLVECRPMTRSDESAARCAVYSGAFAWVLRDIRRLKAFPVKGRLGIYNVVVEEGALMCE